MGSSNFAEIQTLGDYMAHVDSHSMQESPYSRSIQSALEESSSTARRRGHGSHEDLQ